MVTFSLQSGSSGNCIYVEADGVRLLFDAGVAGTQTESRLRAHGRNIREVDALIISHDHDDHVRCSGVLHRKFGLPIHMTYTTQAAIRCDVGDLGHVNRFYSGDTLRFGDVAVHTVPTPHDAADGVAFVVEHAGRRLGILTDLGHPFERMRKLLPTLDAVYLESNYDPELLRAGTYPPHVKKRIMGPHGHLSNHEAAELIHGATRRLQWAVLAHLSANNNTPELAVTTSRKAVGRKLPLWVASRGSAGELLCVR
ncbi:MAG: MBL fold metallo-hydrolase [Planctomycetes bacterium]|nr:MBL fold metallo-hydrolase [Planctomycetota bacterium]